MIQVAKLKFVEFVFILWGILNEIKEFENSFDEMKWNCIIDLLKFFLCLGYQYYGICGALSGLCPCKILLPNYYLCQIYLLVPRWGSCSVIKKFPLSIIVKVNLPALPWLFTSINRWDSWSFIIYRIASTNEINVSHWNPELYCHY